MPLGHRDPEQFLRRFTYGYAATIFTRYLIENAGYDYEPLDYESYQTTFECRNFQDFAHKAKRARKYKGFASYPDINVKNSSGNSVCIIEVSRRNGFWLFSKKRDFEYGGNIFHTGLAEKFQLWLESFNVGLDCWGDEKPTNLDDAYDRLWKDIVEITNKRTIELRDIQRVGTLVFSRKREYAKPQIYDTFFINENKLDNTWIPKQNDCRQEFGNEFQVYYFLWMEDLTSGFEYCTLDDIEYNKGEPERNRFDEKYYKIPFSVFRPMWDFPLFS